MSLTLTVLTYRNQPPARTISKTFLGAGGTIGRLEQNDLVLPDPERTISRTHAQVEFRDGEYFVTGLGQNPIELNGRLLTPGSCAKLASGDRMTLGDYCVLAELAPPITAKPVEEDLGGFVGGGGGREGLSAFGIDLGGGASKSASGSPSNAWEQPEPVVRLGMQRDEVAGFREPLPPAKPVSPPQIPDDYDLLHELGEHPAAESRSSFDAARPGSASPTPQDPFALAGLSEMAAVRQPPPETAPQSVPPAPSSAAQSEPAQFEAVSARTTASQDYIQAVRTVLQAAGVPELEDRVLADPSFLHTVGELLREAIAGLLRALIARALTKRELRVDMTMLATTENNPLKFSPDVSEALAHLLVKRPRKGYLPPVRAVTEAYDDLQAHNLAVIAGTRAALLEVLQRFDPAKLEQRLASHALLDKLLPQNRKARMWDLIAQQHAELVREAQDEFDRVFGRAFRSAYEEQLRKLRAASGKGISI